MIGKDKYRVSEAQINVFYLEKFEGGNKEWKYSSHKRRYERRKKGWMIRRVESYYIAAAQEND